MNLVQIFVPHTFYCCGNIKVIAAITMAFQKYVIQLYFHKFFFLYISIIAVSLSDHCHSNDEQNSLLL